jgi:uncharacterized membrane protein YkvI
MRAESGETDMTQPSDAGWFRRLLLPGLVFQSVVIAGGYGTGRELAEFFLGYGPRLGLLSMILISTTIWSLVCALSFEFARKVGARDYRSFFKALVGRGWVLYEISYAGLLVIIMAVIASASGSILEETFALPYWTGVIGIIAAIALLVFLGSSAVEKALAGWSAVLYAVYLVLFGWSLLRFGPQIAEAMRAPAPDGSGTWPIGGLRYAAYNVALIPALLFATRHLKTRRDAITAGLLAGPLGMIPAILFFTVMAGFYPEIADRPVPANAVLEALGSRTFQIIFQVVLFGTLIETGTGMIHGLNERIGHAVRDTGRTLAPWVRPAVATVLLVLGAFLARFGLIDLIARGYGTLTWAFWLVYLLPLFTLGLWRLSRPESHAHRDPPAPFDSR